MAKLYLNNVSEPDPSAISAACCSPSAVVFENDGRVTRLLIHCAVFAKHVPEGVLRHEMWCQSFDEV